MQGMRVTVCFFTKYRSDRMRMYSYCIRKTLMSGSEIALTEGGYPGPPHPFHVAHAEHIDGADGARR